MKHSLLLDARIACFINIILARFYLIEWEYSLTKQMKISIVLMEKEGEQMTLEEQIKFCEEKAKNIKLKTEPQTFIDIKKNLEKIEAVRELREDISKKCVEETSNGIFRNRPLLDADCILIILDEISKEGE